MRAPRTTAEGAPARPVEHPDERASLEAGIEDAVKARDLPKGSDTEIPLSAFLEVLHHPRLSQLDQVRLTRAASTSVLVDLASRPDLAPGAVASLLERGLPEVDRELMRVAALHKTDQLDLLVRRPEFAQHLAMNEFLDLEVSSLLVRRGDPDVLAALAMNTVVPLSPSFLYRDCRWTALRAQEVDAYLAGLGVDEEAVAALGPSWDGDLRELAEVCVSFAPDAGGLAA
jgi:hypothetical protein